MKFYDKILLKRRTLADSESAESAVAMRPARPTASSALSPASRCAATLASRSARAYSRKLSISKMSDKCLTKFNNLTGLRFRRGSNPISEFKDVEFKFPTKIDLAISQVLAIR